ncbi:hypothetical protein B9T66_04755 [Helicobacter sp. TUL]|uniref:Uncharacterized protein n=1 Tax=Helicobacter equorum TaxID=361872 RepID=A0A3D8IRZ3_9HELI|nr:hypothetical protein B9T66_04755 [Helicobacter sp. TUL]RDU68058.1 hypothetical protein CQA54_03885 [Helicobacter equorum]
MLLFIKITSKIIKMLENFLETNFSLKNLALETRSFSLFMKFIHSPKPSLLCHQAHKILYLDSIRLVYE